MADSKVAPQRFGLRRCCGHRGVLQPQKIAFSEVEKQYRHHGTLRTLRGQATQQSTVKIMSAASDELTVDCIDLANGNIVLFAMVAGLPGKRPIYVKTIDATLHGLHPENPGSNITLQQLNMLTATQVNVAQCASNAAIIKTLRAKPTLTPDEETQLDALLVYNAAVDAHFHTCKYVSFVQDCLGINNINDQNFLVSLHNVPGVDNAWFTGSYMVYCNGDKMFRCLAMAADVCGHELGHGIVANFCGLEYKGHAGALNESYADIFGTAFQFFLANKCGVGQFDWTIGEDVDKYGYLRSMSNPEAKQQPSRFRGEYWADPNSNQDFGGVHQNSGVGNECFYQACQLSSSDVLDMLTVFFNCLKSMSPQATFLDYRDCLKKAVQSKPAPLQEGITTVLNNIGLDAAAISDWTPMRRLADTPKMRKRVAEKPKERKRVKKGSE